MECFITDSISIKKKYQAVDPHFYFMSMKINGGQPKAFHVKPLQSKISGESIQRKMKTQKSHAREKITFSFETSPIPLSRRSPPTQKKSAQIAPPLRAHSKHMSFLSYRHVEASRVHIHRRSQQLSPPPRIWFGARRSRQWVPGSDDPAGRQWLLNRTRQKNSSCRWTSG